MLPKSFVRFARKPWGDESVETLNERLLGYQRQAMRTLGFAYQILEGDEKVIEAERGVVAERLVYLAPWPFLTLFAQTFPRP